MSLTRARMPAMLVAAAVLLLLNVPAATAYDNDGTHQYTVQTAAEIFWFPELADYFSEVVLGAWCEDETDHIYDTSSPWNTIPHFWIADEGDEQINWWGAYGYPNAWMKARIMMHDAYEFYLAGDKVMAYHYLGHVCHLLADQSVPAHVHYDEHADDAYENWMASNHILVNAAVAELWGQIPEITPELQQGIMDYWGGISRAPWQVQTSLYYLMRTTNQRADYFASDGVDGNATDTHGWVDYTGWPDSPRTMDQLVDNDDGDNDDDGDLSRILWKVYPYAINATARLYEAWRDYFDGVPPITTVSIYGVEPAHDGWRNAPIGIALIPEDNDGGSGIYATEYGWAGVTPFDYDGPFLWDHEGILELNCRSMDRFANWEAEQATTFKQDTVPPDAAIVCPLPGDLLLTSGTLTLDFEGTDLRSGVWAMTALLDGAPVSDGQVIDLDAMAGAHSLVVTVEDMAGNLASASVDFAVSIDATVTLNPDMLNLRSQGVALTALVGFPAMYDVNLINASTVMLSIGGVDVPTDSQVRTQGMVGSDGVPERAFSFSRRPFADALFGTNGVVEATVTGELTNGVPFHGTAEITLFSPGNPHAGDPGYEPIETLPETFSLRVGLDRTSGATLIAWAQPEPGEVRIEIFDVQGRPVRAFPEAASGAGFHELVWDGRTGSGDRVSQGIYLVRLTAAGATSVGKAVIAR